MTNRSTKAFISYLLSFVAITLVIQLSAANTHSTTISFGSSEATEAAASSQTKSPPLPTEIVLLLEVEDLPGMADAGSFWEGVFEIRVAEWNEVEDATRAGSTEDLGETLIKAPAPRRNFISERDRSFRISIPVTGALKERLQKRPAVQTFLLRSTVRLFDSKLDQNFAFKLNRVWQSKLFPDGVAKITLKILPDGSYSAWGPLPKNQPAGHTILEVPAAKTSVPTKP